MTEQDLDALKKDALWEFTQRKGELDAVNARVEMTASELEDLARLLRKTTQIPFPDPPKWLNSKAIQEMLEDRELAKQRTREAKDNCDRLAVGAG